MRATRAEIVAYLSTKMEGLYPIQERQNIARIVAAALEGVDKTRYIIDPNEVVAIDNIDKAACDLSNGRPMQYIIGQCDFCGLTFSVTEGVLIPRPETEELVMWVKEVADKTASPSILDLCTGSGCIALSIKNLLPKPQATAIELYDEAIVQAKKNRQNLGIDIEIIKADVLLGLNELSEQKFDIIVSNPPYIPSSESESMHINVTRHEPHSALFVPDDDPLLFYRSIARSAHKLLSEQGAVFFEIHELLAEQTTTMLQAEGYDVELRNDYLQKPRMICCRPTKK